MTDTETPDILNVAPNPPPPEASRREGEPVETVLFLGKSEFEAMLLALRVMSERDKQRMLEAIESRRTPAEIPLAGLYSVYRKANDEERNKMLEAIATPPPDKPPVPDATADTAEKEGTLSFLRVISRITRDHVAAALDTGLDTLTKDEVYVYGQFAALTCCTDGEYDGDLAEIFGISKAKVSELRARELATPPEQDDLFFTSEEQRREEARRQLAGVTGARLMSMAQRQGFNNLKRITPNNSEISRLENFRNGKGVKLERKSRSGLRSILMIQTKLNEVATAKRWRVSVKKLLDYAVIKLTTQNHSVKPKDYEKNPQILNGANPVVTFTVEEWSQCRGVPHTPASLELERKKAIDDCQTLHDLDFSWEEKTRGGKVVAWEGVTPFPEAEVKNGKIRIAFSPKTMAYFLTAPVMPYRADFLKIDERTPNAYALATKLGEMANLNGKRVVSVQTLLYETDYPSKENTPNYRYRDYIINPFLKAMKAIEDVTCLDWEFCLEKGNPLKEGMHPEKDIDTFLSSYIRFSFYDVSKLKEIDKA